MKDNGWKAKTYRDLDVYQLALNLSVDIHKVTLDDLPKFETFEEGGQIRRSSKSIVSKKPPVV